MGKKYLRPVAIMVELETEPMLSITSAETDDTVIGNKPVGGNTPDLSGGRRGEWGDVWK